MFLNVFESNGSLENIDAVFERDDAQFAIVQSDVLSFINTSKDRKLERIARKIKMLFPLYNEEVHLLAKKDIRSIYDLQDKVVAVGVPGSGTHLTSHLIFQATDVWPLKKQPLPSEKALDALKSGKVDAMFYVSGYPVKLFSDMSDESDYHLVPIKDKDLSGFYETSSIPMNTYTWQKNKVDTVAVKSVLMSYDSQNKYCNSAKKMTKTVYENMNWLIQNGHPKWTDVDMYYDLTRWERHECVASIFKNSKSLQQNQLQRVLKDLGK